MTNKATAQITDQITDFSKPGSTSAPKDEVDFLKWLMVGVILVMGIAIGGLLTNYLAEKQASYMQLRDQVKAQNDKIDALTSELKQRLIAPTLPQ